MFLYSMYVADKCSLCSLSKMYFVLIMKANNMHRETLLNVNTVVQHTSAANEATVHNHRP